MCGVFGAVRGRSQLNLAEVMRIGLHVLNHRGSTFAGMAASDGQEIRRRRGKGLVGTVFDNETLAWQQLNSLRPLLGVGHTRYPTVRGYTLIDAQPHGIVDADGPDNWVLCSNGDLPDYEAQRRLLEGDSVSFVSLNDAELLLRWLYHEARGRVDGIPEAIGKAIAEIRGTFSAILMTRDRLFVFRDRFGNRPLVLGELDGAVVIASEDCPFDFLGASFVREVEPGEILVYGPSGLRESLFADAPVVPAHCVFECIYFARPDSRNIFGLSPNNVRYQLGKQLAREQPFTVTDPKQVFVGSIPKSGDLGAKGYAAESGITERSVFVHDGYMVAGSRTFIVPAPEGRRQRAIEKYGVMCEVLARRPVVVTVDDSIVRSETQLQVITKLRRNGAQEVHARIFSPPYAYPCRYGIDTPRTDELIAHQCLHDGVVDIEAIRQRIGADSLGYLSLAGLKKTLAECGAEPEHFCYACFNGEYPI